MTKNVTLATKHLEELSKDYAKKEEELKKKIEEAEKQSLEIIKKAEEEAEDTKKKILQKAEEEKEEIINDARRKSREIVQQAEKTRESLISEIEERIEREAFNKACDLLYEALPEEFKKEVHNLWIDELIKGGFEELKNLHLIEEIKEVKIISAFPLSEEKKKILENRLKEIIKKEFSMREEIDPKIIAGIIISIGDIVLDGSLKNKIRKKVKSG